MVVPPRGPASAPSHLPESDSTRSAVHACVRLSLLPLWLGSEIAARLRERSLPDSVLASLLDERWPGDIAKREAIERRAAAAIGRAADAALLPVVWTDPRYPPALATIADPPVVLWVRGEPDALSAPAVAIVGSRAASPYALEVAERLAADLAASGVVVVSGLARGVDSAAHRGAVRGGGRTVAVLGSGADVVYPAEHVALAADIADRGGAIVSELVPGTPPRPVFFPRRNRIISGLARAVVVIEAGERSGSLITAREALEQGRDVLAVPGNVLTGRNRGAHALLRDGAKIVETADDILAELGMGVARVRPGQVDPLDTVLACFTPGEACDFDDLAGRSGLPAAQLLSRLLDLQLAGWVRRLEGGRFVRFDSPC